MGESAYGCATPQGIMRFWHTTNCSKASTRGRGQKPILGKPMAMMMLASQRHRHHLPLPHPDLAKHIARQMSSLAQLVGPSLFRPTGSKTAPLLSTRAITRRVLAI